MKRALLLIVFWVSCFTLSAQSIAEAGKLYAEGKYEDAYLLYNVLFQRRVYTPIDYYKAAVCADNIGEKAVAKKYFKLAADKRYYPAYKYLADYARLNYQFDEAITNYNTYLEKVSLPDSVKNLINKRLEETKNAYVLLNKVRNVVFTDSVVVPKNTFLQTIKHQEGMGYLYTFNKYFNTQSDTIGCGVYASEKQDKIYYASLQEGFLSLSVSYKNFDDWSESEKVEFASWDISNSNQNYPYLLQDGVTLYFASDGDKSIGGYDIFKAHYNDAQSIFFKPENIGMPFNSIYNDYLLLLDENNGMGYLVSDRFQLPDKVIIYTFMVPQDIEFVDTEDEAELYQKASLCKIELQKQDFKEVEQKTNKEAIFEDFYITDEVVYNSLSDFKNKKARELFVRYQNLVSQIKLVEENLDKKRDEYSQSEDKETLGEAIFMLECQRRQLYGRIRTAQDQVRVAELEFLEK